MTVQDIHVDPSAIHKALEKTGCSSVDELGWKFLGRSGVTVRSYLKGSTCPGVDVLVTLRRLTGLSIDEMIVENTLAA